MLRNEFLFDMCIIFTVKHCTFPIFTFVCISICWSAVLACISGFFCSVDVYYCILMLMVIVVVARVAIAVDTTAVVVVAKQLLVIVVVVFVIGYCQQ